MHELIKVEDEISIGQECRGIKPASGVASVDVYGAVNWSKLEPQIYSTIKTLQDENYCQIEFAMKNCLAA